MFLDASAIVAILAREADADVLLARIEASDTRFYFSPLSLFESASGLARAKTRGGGAVEPDTITRALAAVTELLTALDAEETPITAAIARDALEVARRYGRGVGHPAALNLGDCFAYACARAVDAPLLYKGEDFSRTDMA